MGEVVVTAARRLREVLRGFDPELLSGVECMAVAEELAQTEKACAAARALAARRAAECGAHRVQGFGDAADWVSRVAGSTIREARSELQTAAAVEASPATREALTAGELSLAQASEIAKTEAESPGSEAELLALARRSGLGELREEGRKRRLAVVPPEELFERQHRAREFRHWRDEFGMVRGSFALSPVVGVGLMNRLDSETDRIRRAAGRDEPREAHAADALVKMLSGEGKGRAVSADLVVVCDRRAWRRGRAEAGEPCHIVGGGPVPVRVVQDMAQDAFLKAVVHDGTRIETVAHFGRHIPAELRTALDLGAPPDFGGAQCTGPGCDRRYGLEWDHVDPVANGGLTSFDNLKARCWPHHKSKTERDRAAGLLGPDMPP